MAIREDLVSLAVTFLRDPNVSASPIENRKAFLKSKNLTQEEIDLAFTRANGDAPDSSYSHGFQQQTERQLPVDYGGPPWRQHLPPPEIPKRDWRDWFIMATVMGGVSYGLYVTAKRYIIPLIAPPTPPQLERDKQAIDESFERAFALLDQLAKDTEALKASEQARTERLDSALTEFERMIEELKTASRRREDDSRRITDEVNALKDLVPIAIKGQNESTDARLSELNSELTSLKKLMGQRMNSSPSSAPTSLPTSRVPGTTSATSSHPGPPPSSSPPTSGAFTLNESASSKLGSVDNAGAVAEPATQMQTRPASPFTANLSIRKASIPTWQMASGKKSTTSTTAETTPGPQEPEKST